MLLSLHKENPTINLKILGESGIIGKGSILINYSRNYFQTTGKIKPTEVVWWEHIRDFQVNYWLNINANPAFGHLLDYHVQMYKVIQKDLDYCELSDTMERWIWNKNQNFCIKLINP